MARPKLEAGAQTVRVQIVAPITLVDRVDAWRFSQCPVPSRSEAMRILMAQALDAQDPETRAALQKKLKKR
jgi:hypothetical protein